MTPTPSPTLVVALALTVVLLAPLAAEEPTPISIVRVEDLGFGAVVAGGGAGTVVVRPAGSRTVSGGVTLGSAWGVSAASFTVSGEPSASYAIILPGSATLANGSHTMTVDSFTSDPAGFGALGTAGTQVLAVGATLQVEALQAQGSYSGTFPVTVAYD